MTKAELVQLDERFIDWLGNYDGKNAYEKEKDKRFLVIKETDNSEVYIIGCDTKKELEDVLVHESDDGWYVSGVFDIKVGMEVMYERTIAVKFNNI